MHRIVVCSTCECGSGPGFARALRAEIAARGMAFEVQEHACMSNCAKPLSVAFSAPGKATYLFGGVKAESDLADTLGFAQIYAECPDGWIADARPAGRLRFCLVGRVPA